MKQSVKRTRTLAVVLTAAMLWALCQNPAEGAPSSVSEQENGVGQTSSVTVTDMMGREVTLEEPATRVVALTASDCEILYAIGAGDTLVGRGTYCDYPAQVSEVPVVDSETCAG